jgi:hypothetical protein
MEKKRNRLEHCKNHSETNFFETQKPSQKQQFWSFKRAVCLPVFESQKSLFHYGFYSVLSDVDFFVTIKSC